MARSTLIGIVILGFYAWMDGTSPGRAQERTPAELAKERLAVLVEMDNSQQAARDAGRMPVFPEKAELEYLWSRRRMDAERDEKGAKEYSPAMLKAHLGRMKKVEERMEALLRIKRILQIEVLAARFYRLEAEYQLAKETP